MKLSANKNLTKWYILFMFLLSMFLGEILPVWLQELPQNDPGAKKSMFTSWDMFIPTMIIYALLSLLFWWLYRKLHWLYIGLIAAVLGVIMEFTFMRPEESGGPNVVEDPWGALLFFIVIWPILILAPYALFNLGKLMIIKMRKK